MWRYGTPKQNNAHSSLKVEAPLPTSQHASDVLSYRAKKLMIHKPLSRVHMIGCVAEKYEILGVQDVLIQYNTT